MFHQQLNLIRAFINYETSTDETVQCLQKELTISKNKLKARLTEHNALVNNEIDKICNNINKLSVTDMYARVTAKIPFGKYKGQRVCDIALFDKQYLVWFFNTTKISFDKLFIEENVSNDILNVLDLEIKAPEHPYDAKDNDDLPF